MSRSSSSQGEPCSQARGSASSSDVRFSGAVSRNASMHADLCWSGIPLLSNAVHFTAGVWGKHESRLLSGKFTLGLCKVAARFCD